jgi:hypothetical protein
MVTAMNGMTKIRMRPTMMAMAEPVEDSHFLPPQPKRPPEG